MSLDFGRRAVVLPPVARLPLRPLVVCGVLVLDVVTVAVGGVYFAWLLVVARQRE